MRTTLLAFALVVSGMSGNLQAASHRTPVRRAPVRHAPVRHRAATSAHKVRKGETAVRIARDHGLTLEDLHALNPRVNLARLHAGMDLNVVAEKRADAGPARAALAAPRPSGVPVAPLPGTPSVGAAPLVHLERILPNDVQSVPPAADSSVEPGKSGPAAALSAASPSLAGLRPVLPRPAEAASEDESGDPLVVPSLDAASGEFQPADRNNLDLLWPVQTRTISSVWGPRIRTRVVRIRTRASHNRRVLRRFMGTHKGVDLSSPMGKDIFAALDGEVVASATQKGYGNYVAIDHGNGVVTLYAHCSRNFVNAGDIVHRGQKIAEVGRTGNATGPHVHFELRLDGVARNPLPCLNDSEEVPADMMAQNEAAEPPALRH